ncbi:MAG: hypothetical protein K0A90_05800 [Methanosarcinaceae archaeon]|nr:hypothetical protein [Methanosarcinaceae archaeon]
MAVIKIMVTLVLLLTIVPGIASASKDCTICHVNGVWLITSEETIVKEETCFNCHNSKYSLDYSELKTNIHLIHTGEYKVEVDAITRHPDSTNKSCNDCHKYTYSCTSCHQKSASHAKGEEDCIGCHGKMSDLFNHKYIELKKHDFLGPSSCTMCHDPVKKSLKLANDDVIVTDQSYKLCSQCHNDYYKSWILGTHWVDVTTLSNESKRSGNVDSDPEWARENLCTKCHDPHNPSKLLWKPSPKQDESGNNYLLIIVVPIILVFSGIILVYRRRRGLH